ncbi:MAG: aminotransferase class I/II-fold pyridoxal phosphate-dependent enzyme [Kocuria sp.]|nr:aminotransferase class I/II-fold pyridoxal phosphate-dependent enzyme [Kocuria sp.]
MSTDWTEWAENRQRVRNRRALGRTAEPPPPPRTAAMAIDFRTNDYLGLGTRGLPSRRTSLPAGAGSSRVVAGTHPEHRRLEAELAHLAGAQDALVFSSGYLANLGIIGALDAPGTTLLMDDHVHASLRDAARAASSHREFFPHQDLTNLAHRMEDASKARPGGRIAVIVESVYSVVGDATDLDTLARVCATHRALLVVDEAHSFATVPQGTLTRTHDLCSHERDTTAPMIVTASLSKALAGQGGVILFGGSPGQAALWRDHLVNTARPFIFDTGLSPLVAEAALEACTAAVGENLAAALEERRRCALSALRRRPAVERILEGGAGPILSLRMPSPDSALGAARELDEAGIRVGVFRPPSVPDNISRLRLSVHADHRPDQLVVALEQVASVVERAWGITGRCPFAQGDARPADHRYRQVLVEDPATVRDVMGDPESYVPDNALTTNVPLVPAARRILATVGFQLPAVLASASGELHRKVRRITTPYFSATTVRRRLPDIRRICRDSIRELEAELESGPVDLSRTIAFSVPARSLQLLSGMPAPESSALQRWSADSLELFWGWPERTRQLGLARSAADFYAWLRTEVQGARGEENLFADLLAAGVGLERVVSLGYFLVIAGQETTRMLIGTALHRALGDRSLWSALGNPESGPGTAKELIRETLRAYSSVPTWRRQSAVSVDSPGLRAEPGDHLLLRLSGEALQDHRLAFGHGIHRCLGAALAEQEASLVVHDVARNLPGLRPSGAPPSWLTLLSFQSPQHVIVENP